MSTCMFKCISKGHQTPFLSIYLKELQKSSLDERTGKQNEMQLKQAKNQNQKKPKY